MGIFFYGVAVAEKSAEVNFFFTALCAARRAGRASVVAVAALSAVATSFTAVVAAETAGRIAVASLFAVSYAPVVGLCVVGNDCYVSCGFSAFGHRFNFGTVCQSGVDYPSFVGSLEEGSGSDSLNPLLL